MKQAVEKIGRADIVAAVVATGKPLVRKIAVLLLTVVISACTTMQAPDSEFGVREAQRLSQQGDHDGASRQYFDLALQSADASRQRYLILGARELYLANDLAGAANILSQVENGLSPSNLDLWAQVAAEVRLSSGEPERALAALDRVQTFTNAQAASKLLMLRGEALFRLGRPNDAVTALVEREAWLTNPVDLDANRRMIWTGLQTSGAALSLTPGTLPEDPVITGWLELGFLSFSRRSEPLKLREDLEAWRAGNPYHPASATLLTEVLENLDALMNYPQQVALLLPLTGRQQSQAEAIRDGFLAAHFGLQGIPTRPAISVYDTGRLEPVEAYRRALIDGADFVVGPLLKDSVAAVAADAGKTTTLALNFLPDNTRTPSGFYQFALSPEDEARQAAARAVAEGHRRAVALAPDTLWGQRMLTSFADELEALGGQLLDSRLYDTRSPDFSATIRGLMLLDESTARQERLAANLGTTLAFEPRRREDVDLIFVAANARNAKLIRPQLRFHYAGSIPTYSTSAVFEVGSSSNSDLNGIMFPDIPWLIDPDPTASDLKVILAQYWSDKADRRSRLYAMGYDAYRLMPLLNGEVKYLRSPVAGMTGELVMDESGRMHRNLTWARIVRGQPQLLPDLPRPLTGEIDTAMIDN